MENEYFNILMKLAKKALNKNEVPVSALITYNDKIIAKFYNKKNIKGNSLYHAEILCIDKACKKLKRWNLDGCKMYITLEPCDMCKMAIQEARIQEVFYLVSKGNITNKYKKTRYEQMFAFDCDEYRNLLKYFFKNIRK